MSASKPRPTRLGRGLSSLMAQPVRVALPSAPQPQTGPTDDTPPAQPAEHSAASDGAAPSPAASPSTLANASLGLHLLPIESITPNPLQPRQRFDPAALESLAASIRSEGLMQPIIVRRAERRSPGDTSGPYELVAGERRWRAAKIAGVNSVPALVRDLDDRQLAEWALVENIQREDLNPIERAEAFRGLTDRFGLSHADVAERIGLDRSTITNLLRLLDLEPSVRDLIRDGLLSMGQARALAGLSDPAMQKALAQRVIAEGMSVRAVEAAVKRAAPSSGAVASAIPPVARRANHLGDLEQQIARQLGTKVQLRSGRKKGSGAITIEFYSLDQFDTILSKLGVVTE